MDPAQQAAQLQAILDLAHFGQVTRYSHVAAYTLFVYDWLLSLGEESKLVFNSGASRGKIAYMFCRYWPLLTYPITMWIQVTDHDRSLCSVLYKIPMFMTIPNLASAALILILRLYAFTGGKAFVAAFLGSCLLGVATYQLFVAGARSALIPIGNGCFPVDTGAAKHLSGYFLSALLLDCVITITFVIYALRHVRIKYTEMSTFTRVFIREGAAYFIAISSINIINGAFNFQPLIPMQTVAVPFGLLTANLLACRLVLNLRSAVGPDENSTHPLSVSVQSEGLRFASESAYEEYTLSDMGAKVPAVPAKRSSRRPSGVPQQYRPSSTHPHPYAAARASTQNWAPPANRQSVQVFKHVEQSQGYAR